MLPKQTRRRFLLNTGMLAAGSELSCADVVLAQELAPTPSCHDDNEPTVRETEGPVSYTHLTLPTILLV